jgi:aspartate aminotransferase
LELSQRVRNIKPSPTLAITARAAQLKAEGKDIVNLGVGEPDFDTPSSSSEAGHRRHQQRLHQATPPWAARPA